MRYSQRIGIDCDFPYTDSDFAQFSDVAQRDHGRLVHKLESKCRKPANNSVSDGQNYLYIAEVKNKRWKNKRWKSKTHLDWREVPKMSTKFLNEITAVRARSYVVIRGLWLWGTWKQPAFEVRH